MQVLFIGWQTISHAEFLTGHTAVLDLWSLHVTPCTDRDDRSKFIKEEKRAYSIDPTLVYLHPVC